MGTDNKTDALETDDLSNADLMRLARQANAATDYEKTLSYLRVLISRPEARTQALYLFVAQVQDKRKRPQKALEALRFGLSLPKSDIQVRMVELVCRILYRTRAYKQILSYLDKYDAGRLESTTFLNYYVHSHVNLADPSKAAEIFMANTSGLDVDHHLRLAEVIVRHLPEQGALDTAEAIANRLPRGLITSEQLTRKIRILATAARHDEALKTFQELVEVGEEPWLGRGAMSMWAVVGQEGLSTKQFLEMLGGTQVQHITLHLAILACYQAMEEGDDESANLMSTIIAKAAPEAREALAPALRRLLTMLEDETFIMTPASALKELPEGPFYMRPANRCERILWVVGGVRFALSAYASIFEAYAAPRGIHLIYLKDHNRLCNAVGLGKGLETWDDNVEAMKAIQDRLGCERSATIGISAGGIAAIRLSQEVGGDGCISFAGMTFVSTDPNSWDTRAAFLQRRIRIATAGVQLGDTKPVIENAHDAVFDFHYGMGMEIDRRHAERVAELPNVWTIGHPCDSHDLVPFLAEKGTLYNYLDDFLGRMGWL